MNASKSPLARFPSVFSRIFASFSSGAHSDLPSHPHRVQNRIWPIDPRGEEIRTAKARRLGVTTSVQKLNLVAKLVRNLTVSEAYRQLAGCKKKSAPIVAATIRAAATNARAFGLNQQRLVISEAFVGKGVYLRKLRPWHGKGRFGIEHKKYAHLTVKVRELDDELWEAKVLPQYVHTQRSTSKRDHDLNHPIHQSSLVSWTSDLDEGFRKTRQAVSELKATIQTEDDVKQINT